MFIEALAAGLQKAQSTNSTDGSYPARLPTITRPAASATRAVFDMQEGLNLPNMEVTPFGGNDNNDVINLLVLGWNSTLGAAARKLYVPRVVCDVQATLSATLVGVAAADVVATEFFADTLTLTSGIATLRQGTADRDVASFLCDVSGFELVEIIFDLGAGGDAQNALVRFF